MEVQDHGSSLRDQFAHLLEDAPSSRGAALPDASHEDRAMRDEGGRAAPTVRNSLPLVLTVVTLCVAGVAYMHREELIAFCKGPSSSATALRETPSVPPENLDDEDDDDLVLEDEDGERIEEVESPSTRSVARAKKGSDPMFESF